jgi:hypothetical protein
VCDTQAKSCQEVYSKLSARLLLTPFEFRACGACETIRDLTKFMSIFNDLDEGHKWALVSYFWGFDP